METPDTLLRRTWIENSCGDETCMKKRLDAAVAVLTGVKDDHCAGVKKVNG